MTKEKIINIVFAVLIILGLGLAYYGYAYVEPWSKTVNTSTGN